MKFTEAMKTAKGGVEILQRLKKYAKYIQATVRTIEFAVNEFSGITDESHTISQDKDAAELVVSPNENQQ